MTTSHRPHLRIRIDESGAPSCTLDGDDYIPPGGPHLADRESVRDILDAIRADVGAVQVEIVEADGTVYSDVLTADRTEDASGSTNGEPDRYASGFLPGEQIAVAVIISEHPASDDGTTRVRLPAAVLAHYGGTVMLLGRSSGTLTFLGNER